MFGVFDWNQQGQDDEEASGSYNKRGSTRSNASGRNSITSESSTSRKGSRQNSTGMKEEFLGPRGDYQDSAFVEEREVLDEEAKKKKEKLLLLSFLAMLFVGLLNKIFNKLMTIPMYNYPNTLNLLTTTAFVFFTFLYIIPMARAGKIPKDQLEMSRKPFAVMGTLDAIAAIMQVFSATYLPGPLLILLQQAAIPISMVISKYMLNATYNRYQYVGAAIVASGIAVVLVPTMTGGGSPLWSIMMIFSCIPMTLSSVYKEIALGERELDPMYLNGWIAIFQLGFTFVLVIPAAMAGSPAVYPQDLPTNLADGFKCYTGENSIVCDDDNDDDTPCSDDCYIYGPIFVTIYIVVNFLYNVLILLILKYGTANLLWLALTLMVPLGNVAFTLDFMPQSQELASTDIIGLVIICMGLFCYRFLYELLIKYGYEIDDDYAKDMFRPSTDEFMENKGLLTKLMEDSSMRDESDVATDGLIQ